MFRRVETLASQYEPRFSLFDPRWNTLRRIGNSPIARASIAMPVVGYLLLFHSQLIGFLKLDVVFGPDIAVPWRLYTLYFAGCFFATGSVIYAWRCPRTVKSYESSRDFVEAEKEYYRGPNSLGYLFELFDQADAEPSVAAPLRTRPRAGMILSEDDLPHLYDLMRDFYFIENRRAPFSRIAVAISYTIGGLLLAIPAIITFFQILLHALTLIQKYLSTAKLTMLLDLGCMMNA
jgi:hypothetical protein